MAVASQNQYDVANADKKCSSTLCKTVQHFIVYLTRHLICDTLPFLVTHSHSFQAQQIRRDVWSLHCIKVTLDFSTLQSEDIRAKFGAK